ncbi:MAG: hypothetical protein JNM68_05755 [Dinghuibacter sp.]|nr:hypothetical protein [Dinghuibacter sp.]
MSTTTLNGVTTLTPTLTLPLNLVNSDGKDVGQAEAFKLWATIPVNDDRGITIDNVLKGDEIFIYDASGIGSFKETNMGLVKAILGMANSIATAGVLYLTDGAAAPFVKAWDDGVKKIGDAVGNNLKHGRRDMYGRDPGTGDYGKHEGGLIVCMPETRGPVYATSDYYLEDGSKEHGRKYQYYSDKAKHMNVIYPCNVPDGRLSAVAGADGAIHILAFDSDFQDNAGSYTVGLIVVRYDRPSGRSSNELIRQLKGLAPVSASL